MKVREGAEGNVLAPAYLRDKATYWEKILRPMGGGSLHPSPLNPPLNLGKSGAVVYRAVCNLRFVFTVAAEWQVTENITHMPCWPPPIPGSIKTTLQCWGLKERKSSTWGRPGSYLTPGFQRSVSVAVAVAVSVKTVSVQAVYADAAGAGARQ